MAKKATVKKEEYKANPVHFGKTLLSEEGKIIISDELNQKQLKYIFDKVDQMLVMKIA